MLIRCISNKPSDEQAQKLGIGKNYFPGRQDFGLTVGEQYTVYGITIRDGETWVDIRFPRVDMLHSAPLCLFEIVDRRVSRYWVVGLGAHGNLGILPASILDQPYYFDDLSESVPDVVDDFRRLKDLLETEAALDD